MSAKKRYGATETALNRHETFRDGFRRMGMACIVMAAACCVTAGMAWWAASSKPAPKYFLAREDGGIIPLVAVDQPYLSDGQVTNFAVEAITKSMTLNFVTWRQDLSESSEYFERPDGWNNFLQVMEESDTLNFIRNRRLISSVVANGAAIINRGTINGRYNWVVQVPITVTYQSSSEKNTANHIAEIQIARLPTWQTSRGVGITRVLIK